MTETSLSILESGLLIIFVINNTVGIFFFTNLSYCFGVSHSKMSINCRLQFFFTPDSSCNISKYWWLGYVTFKWFYLLTTQSKVYPSDAWSNLFHFWKKKVACDWFSWWIFENRDIRVALCCLRLSMSALCWTNSILSVLASQITRSFLLLNQFKCILYFLFSKWKRTRNYLCFWLPLSRILVAGPRLTVPRQLRWAGCGAVCVSSTTALLVRLFSPECEPQNIAAYDKPK